MHRYWIDTTRSSACVISLFVQTAFITYCAHSPVCCRVTFVVIIKTKLKIRQIQIVA